MVGRNVGVGPDGSARRVRPGTGCGAVTLAPRAARRAGRPAAGGDTAGTADEVARSDALGASATGRLVDGRAGRGPGGGGGGAPGGLADVADPDDDDPDDPDDGEEFGAPPGPGGAGVGGAARRVPVVPAGDEPLAVDPLGDDCSWRRAERFTTGVGPVSKGSPLTSGLGAHSSSPADEGERPRPDARVRVRSSATDDDEEDDEDEGGGSTDGAASGRTKRGRSSDASGGPGAVPPVLA